MNPLDLSASELLIWGLVIHLMVDWLLQSNWMAQNKMERRYPHKVDSITGVITTAPWWDRHPAAYVHAGLHGLWLSWIFGWVAVPLAVAHLVIDCRWIVVRWANLIDQTPATIFMVRKPPNNEPVALMDVGSVVRLWVDQVFHIVCIAVAALLITL